jgi:hypothetical protein
LFLAFAAGLGLTPGGVAAVSAAPSDVLKVTLDQAKIMQLPTGVKTLVVGNPAIADVTMLKSGAIVLTGKGYGETNLIALDAQGNIIDEKLIEVEPTRSVLVVQRGNSRESYWCNPTCMPTVQLGDEDKAFTESIGQIGARNTLAQGGATK